MIWGHGDDRYQYGFMIRADFSSNVPAGVDHRGLHAFLRERLSVIGRYPEPAPYSLEHELAGRHGIESASVMATNGATEAIYLVAHLRAGATSEIVQPTFAEYADAGRLYGHRIETVREPWHPTAEMLWCCNPNNPTGTVWDADRLLETVDAHPGTLFVIDQSYAAFTLQPTLAIADAVRRPNLILIHSMTKQYAVPGLRLGYLTAHSDLCGQLRRLRMPWAVNALAIEAGHYLLQHGAPAPPLHELLGEAAKFAQALRATDGYDPMPTDTHFMTVGIRRAARARELKTWLVQRYGLLIRDASNFEGLTERHFRVAVQHPAANDLLIQALTEWIR